MACGPRVSDSLCCRRPGRSTPTTQHELQLHSDRIDRLHGEIARAAEPMTPLQLRFDEMDHGGMCKREPAQHAARELRPRPLLQPAPVHDFSDATVGAPLPSPAAGVGAESKLELLERNIVAALGLENYTTLCAHAAQSGGRLELGSLPDSLRRAAGDEALADYAPVVEQLVFLREAATPMA